MRKSQRQKRQRNKVTEKKVSVNRNQKNSSNSLNIKKLSFTPTGVFMPEQFRTTCIYYEQVDFTAVTTPQTYIYRLNAPYDPNQTGTGLQPQGWDNFATFYEQNFCVGSRIELEVFNGSTTVMQVGIAPTPQTSTLSSWLGLMIYPKSKHLNIDGTTRGSNSFGKISHEESILRFYGEDFDRDYLAASTSVPGKQAYWTVLLNSADSVSALSLSMQITIHYDIVFTTPKLVALS